MNTHRTISFWLVLLVGQLFAWLLASVIATAGTFGLHAATQAAYPSGLFLQIVGFAAHVCLAIATFFVARTWAKPRPRTVPLAVWLRIEVARHAAPV